MQQEGALGANWERPYIIKEDFGNGTDWLQQLNGNMVKNSWNAEHLHHFLFRLNFCKKFKKRLGRKYMSFLIFKKWLGRGHRQRYNHKVSIHYFAFSPFFAFYLKITSINYIYFKKSTKQKLGPDN